MEADNNTNRNRHSQFATEELVDLLRLMILKAVTGDVVVPPTLGV